MRILRRVGVAFCAFTALMLFATTAQAQAGEPHYLRALADLRTARDYLQYDQNPATTGDRHHAVGEINHAIQEIKNAAWDDGRNTEFATPTGPITDPWRAVKEAERWVTKAGDEVARGIDPPQAMGARDRAMMHIEAARRILKTMHHYWGDR
jgi:hypothetical protein